MFSDDLFVFYDYGASLAFACLAGEFFGMIAPYIFY